MLTPNTGKTYGSRLKLPRPLPFPLGALRRLKQPQVARMVGEVGGRGRKSVDFRGVVSRTPSPSPSYIFFYKYIGLFVSMKENVLKI